MKRAVDSSILLRADPRRARDLPGMGRPWSKEPREPPRQRRRAPLFAASGTGSSAGCATGGGMAEVAEGTTRCWAAGWPSRCSLAPRGPAGRSGGRLAGGGRGAGAGGGARGRPDAGGGSGARAGGPPQRGGGVRLRDDGGWAPRSSSRRSSPGGRWTRSSWSGRSSRGRRPVSVTVEVAGGARGGARQGDRPRGPEAGVERVPGRGRGGEAARLRDRQDPGRGVGEAPGAGLPDPQGRWWARSKYITPDAGGARRRGGRAHGISYAVGLLLYALSTGRHAFAEERDVVALVEAMRGRGAGSAVGDGAAVDTRGAGRRRLEGALLGRGDALPERGCFCAGAAGAVADVAGRPGRGSGRADARHAPGSWVARRGPGGRLRRVWPRSPFVLSLLAGGAR